MIPEIEIWHAALAMVRRYAEDAMLEAVAPDQLLEDSDMATSAQLLIDLQLVLDPVSVILKMPQHPLQR